MGGLFFLTDFSAWAWHISYQQIGSIDGDKENYPVPITVQYNASYMRSDFGDIRFALSDGTELKYCIDNLVETDHCDFLVVLPSFPASPSTTTITVYAGNSSVTTTSDPSSVYELYDDFVGSSLDTTKWNVVGSPTLNVNNSELTISRVPSSNWSFHGITSKNYQFNNNNGTEKIIVKFKRSNVLQSASSNISSRYFSKGKINDLSQQGITELILQTDDRDEGGGFYGTGFTTSFATGTYYTLQMSQNNGVLTAILNTETETSSNAIFTAPAPIALGLIEWQSYSATHDLIIDYIKILQTTPNPPKTGTIGEWTENSPIISTPPIQSILTVNTPQITVGGGIRITAPPIGLTSSVNIPISRAIISSPPITAMSSIIPPVIAFLMEVKAGVTYNPDAINDLKEDGIPCNISFNVTIGDQQYE